VASGRELAPIQKKTMNQGQKHLTEFLNEFIKSEKIEKKALVRISSLNSIDKKELNFEKEYSSKNDLLEEDEKFDFVFADLPFGMNSEVSRLDPTKKVNRNWNSIVDSVNLISDQGILFAVAEPAIYSSKKGRDFVKSLENIGVYNNMVLNAPEKIYSPQTIFSPIILGLSKKKKEQLFIAEIEDGNYELVISNYQNEVSEGITNGNWINADLFSTFDKLKIENQINSLRTQYKEYKQYKLSDISKSINLTRETFEDKDNSIYIPKIGTSDVVSSIEKTKIKHQNYFQVELDSQIVIADYLELFYKSQLGRLILDSLSSGSFIPSINKSSIQDSYIAIPSINEQKILIYTNSKLTELQKTIDDLKLELSLNPKNAKVILDKFESIQTPLMSLSKEDEIKSLIRKGESKLIEFKQTFSKNIRTNQKDKEIEKSSLKTIVGFLNSDGGTLLIGVTDDGAVNGIEEDFYKSSDKYLLHFKNAINLKIGSGTYPLIDYDIYSVSNKSVLRVDCKPSTEPCYFEEKEFYVRTNPATDRLEGKKQNEYIKRRFYE